MTLPGGRRPAVIVTRDVAIGLLGQVVVAPVTRTIRGIPSEIVLTHAEGMPAECAVSADNLQIVPKGVIKGRITTLSVGRLEELCDALRYALGC